MTVFSTNRVTFSPLFSNSASAVWARNNSRLAFLNGKMQDLSIRTVSFFLHCLTKLGKVFLKKCWCLRLKMSSFAACVAFPSSPKIISLHAFPPSQMKTTRKHESFPFKKVFRRKMRKMQNAPQKRISPPISCSLISLFLPALRRTVTLLSLKNI